MLSLTEGRTYVCGPSTRWSGLILGALLAVGGAVSCFFIWRGGSPSQHSLKAFLVLGAIFGGFIALGAAVIVQVTRQRLTLFADRLEYQSGWRLHTVRRAEIGAIKSSVKKGTPGI